MASIRQKKFAAQLQKELAPILAREVQVPNTVLVTLTHLQVSPDLRVASCYITTLPELFQQEIVTHLNENVGEVRHLLAQRIRNVVRYVPELRFYEDDTMKVANRLDELFEELNHPDKDNSPQEGGEQTPNGGQAES